MKKKTIIAITMILLISLLLTACSGKGVCHYCEEKTTVTKVTVFGETYKVCNATKCQQILTANKNMEKASEIQKQLP